ncbi:serine/threonine protein kinase [Polyangium aurulentum]|uniref:serine/threonine protein kinase n=1 Tax=Polyangium aurulentum TaxID=2567896 RepID=UPI00146AA59B|nr:serine/threonine-protein kinase [Polyangium aurulentum]UQA59688.1 protein kinase [Polyangium aurulentum]
MLATGTVFHGAYEVVGCIKSGGMGSVYEVVQRNTERRRALKVMLPCLVSDPELRARFELEAKVAAGIESEHIVETLDAGVDDATGMPFIVMELLKGEEIGKLLKAKKRLPPDEVVTLLHQAALALDRTHAAGIVHRDLKPENLFLTRRDDGSPRLKILDFGVAKIVADGTVTSASTKSVGSPLYMAPEQIAGDQKIGPAVDRYALAHIAFTMLVGKPYWARERKAADGLYPYLMKVVKGAKVPARERAAELGVTLPETFDAWFARATSTSPDERHASAAELVVALAGVLDVPAPAGPMASSTRAPFPSIAIDTGSDAGPDAPRQSFSNLRPSTAPTLTAPKPIEPKEAKEAKEAKEPSTDTAPSLVVPPLAMSRSEAPPAEDASGTSSTSKPRRGRAIAVTLLAAGLITLIGAVMLVSPLRGTRSSDSQPAPASAGPQPAPTEAPRPSPIEAAPSAEATAAVAPAASAAPLATGSAAPAPTSAPSVVPAVLPMRGSGKGPATGAGKPPRGGKDPLNEY